MGKKKCKQCGTEVGPRSRHCTHCGHGFLIKGIQYPNVNPATLVSSKEARSISSKSENLPYLMNFIVECTDDKENLIREKYYGIDSSTWESICGNFRIRYGPFFMCIKTMKPFMLLMKSKDGDWGLCPGKYRFKTIEAAIKYMMWWKQQNAKVRLDEEQKAQQEANLEDMT